MRRQGTGERNRNAADLLPRVAQRIAVVIEASVSVQRDRRPGVTVWCYPR
jgi:hypothetical protein